MSYKTSFLEQVIVRLDFATLAALQSDKQPEFSAELKKQLPVVRGQQMSQIILSASARTAWSR